MKRERAVHHLKALVESCTDMQTMLPATAPLRVVQLWALGRVLEAPAELDVVQVALVVDLPVDDVPWLDEPKGAQHWANAVRLNKNPVHAYWRSAHAPVWNHEVVRPVLLWDAKRRR